MLLHPDIAKKAQRELDVVTGRDRLPTLEDRLRLPFVDAVCKEALRWQPVLPLGMPTDELPREMSERLLHAAVPHAATEDDIYNGFLIPKGLYSFCLVIAITLTDVTVLTRRDSNTEFMVKPVFSPCFSRAASTSFFSRAILRDPTTYPDPAVFRPERFLDPDGNLHDDPTLVSGFGYGKRICPGRHLAEATLFIVAASVLSVFDIERGPGCEDGPFRYSYTGLVVRHVHRWFLRGRGGGRTDRILLVVPNHSLAVWFRGTNERRS